MKSLKSILTATILFSVLLSTTSCDDNLIYDEAADCAPHIQFVFKKHRHALNQVPGRETDAFYSTVESVHLFAYDAQSGELVWDKTERTENLKSAADLEIGTDTDKCYLPLDLREGKYKIVAWCGLDGEDANNAFRLSALTTRGGYTHCEVKLEEENIPVHAEKYEAVYHGRTEAAVDYSKGAERIITLELTKNTNDIAVWVQHASKTFSEGEYEVVYTDANGTMHFEDNTMINDRRLEYNAHSTSLLTSTTEYNGSEMESGALVAHLSTSRLMAAHKDDARIEVRTKEGKTVFSIPFIKYVLSLQTATDDHQYYLDCEDTYNCSFYLTGESGNWMPARIIINNWVVVPDQNNEI